MKTQYPTHTQRGFTLVELLVVIAIIAVLASAGFAGGQAAMNKARKVTAQAAATSVVTAIEQFYAEYSSLPDVSASSTTISGDGVKLLNVLAGTESGTGENIQNDRKIRFLSMKEAKKGKRDGVVYTGGGNQIEGLYDPWGGPYYVELDTTYEERLSFTPTGNPMVQLNGRRAAVYSLGVRNSGDATPSSLVKTW